VNPRGQKKLLFSKQSFEGDKVVQVYAYPSISIHGRATKRTNRKE
jgi:hypothetical protein